MATAVSTVRQPAPPQTQHKIYKVGTLRYTAFGLGMVFFWLLWGDFIWRLMEDVVPGIMPLRWRALGASYTTMTWMGAVGATLTFLVSPTIGFRSDRTRSRLGRRIPYLAYSTPFLSLFLILLGCSGSIGEFLTGPAGRIFGTMTTATVTIGVTAVVMVGYQFSNVFVNTIYWYLFNDVVPKEYLGRFLSLFRIVSQGANAFWHLVIFPHSQEYFQYVFIGAGVMYMLGFTLMCFMVKEGRYPPPPENVDVASKIAIGGRKGVLGWLTDRSLALLMRFYGTRRVINSMATFAKECFTHRFYWNYFLSNALMAMSGSAMFAMLIRNVSMGIDLGTIGKINTARDLISMALMYPAGWLADKFHPVRLFVILSVAHMIVPIAQMPYMFADFGYYGNLYYLIVISIVLLPIGIVQDCAGIPMMMRLLPKDRYGQFCSANAMIRAIGAILGGLCAGPFMDLMERLTSPEWGPRMFPAWVVTLQLASLVFLLMLYRQWKALGGVKSYEPPGA